MKRNRKSSFSTSEDLNAAAVKRAGNLHYSSLSAYINGLILMDLITQPSHKLAFQVNGLGWRAMERLVAALIAQEDCPLRQVDEGAEADNLISMAAAYKERREAPIPTHEKRGAKTFRRTPSKSFSLKSNSNLSPTNWQEATEEKGGFR